ncbi:Hsp20/alpha crystallin family protein [Lacihabitans sp. CCS-44]|uniref:Hsp20/alpha crystallin family protein n=1 Tax=Lacihabitans sp. CCS-44 TaxID=2487331 RepID=UPI0020CBED77|nr:Hsp20/alpha crystallin family protein [Lacihabitans sp. CCS-44]MCP9756597.1 Hsp20/alpha crystallin family protein [Lacihabitans sp. CCS-44]
MKTLVRNYDNLNSFPALFNELFGEQAVSKFNKNVPSANIKETEDNFGIELVVPGFKKEAFKVEVHERNLTISAGEKTESEEKTETFLRKEYSFGSFTRSFRLPNTVDSDNIEASYEDGVLHLTIPKKEEAKPKEPKLISIN